MDKIVFLKLLTVILSITAVSAFLLYAVATAPTEKAVSKLKATLSPHRTLAATLSPTNTPEPTATPVPSPTTSITSENTTNSNSLPSTFPLNETYATVRIQMPERNITSGSLTLTINVEYYVYESTKSNRVIPYRDFICLYSIDNAEPQPTALGDNVSQNWCISLANGGGWNEVFCSYNTILSGLTDGLHCFNATISPSQVWMHDGYSCAQIALLYFTVHDHEIFCCRIDLPFNSTGGNRNVWLRYTLNAPAVWVDYSLDDQANSTITMTEPTIPNVASSSHYVTVYAEDVSGTITRSNTVHFSIE